MKVHNFQIEVMWLFLAVSFSDRSLLDCESAFRATNGFEQRTIRFNSIQKEPYSSFRVRPPP
ncbi:MAG: hypothetical protein JW715_07500 [Sedimentisphaerales bacterium]|nr:hypothetical protein [Sedimentisphaerales bacterium]